MKYIVYIMMLFTALLFTACADAGDDQTVTVFVSPNKVTHNPPIAKITVSSSEINFGESVTLSAIESSDVDGNIVSYAWLNENNTTLSANQEFSYTFSTAGEHTITLKVTDNEGLVGTTTQTVMVKAVLTSDKTPPSISLRAEENMTLTQGQAYEEYGATAFDDVDGSVSVTISGSVDTNTVGTYTIRYTATDNAGNFATRTITVNVLPKYGVVVSEVFGNTALLYGQAEFYLSLRSQPEANVTIPLLSSDTNEADIIGDKELIFTPENWYEPQTVSITGKNKNLGDAQQQYKIILGRIVSDDENYNDLDPDDVEMKFKVLSISKPDDKYDFVPTSEKRICLKVNTALHKRLTYNLIDVPTGMVHELENIHSPCLVWKAPVSESGTTHNITIEVTDGTIRKEVNFEIHVADTTPLQSQIEGDSVTITEPNSNLKGFRITRLDKSINLEDIKFRKVIAPYLLDHGRNRISDIFIVEKKVVGKIKVTIPQLVGEHIKRDTTVALFGPIEHHGFVSYQASGSSCCNLLIPGRVELINKFGIGFGHEFLGLESKNFNDS